VLETIEAKLPLNIGMVLDWMGDKQINIKSKASDNFVEVAEKMCSDVISTNKSMADAFCQKQVMRRIAMSLASLHPGWTGQKSQDRDAIALLRNQMDDDFRGFFVDVGASEPMYNSNSYTMETQLGWHGLCIEGHLSALPVTSVALTQIHSGNPKFTERLQRERKCKVVQAVVDSEDDGSVQFNMMTRGIGGIVANDTETPPESSRLQLSMEGTKNVTTMPTVALCTILRKHKVPEWIDFLSLDVEGAEFRVMRTFCFKEFKFKTLTVSRPSEQLHSLLEENGYVHVSSSWSFCLPRHSERLKGLMYDVEFEKLHAAHGYARVPTETMYAHNSIVMGINRQAGTQPRPQQWVDGSDPLATDAPITELEL